MTLYFAYGYNMDRRHMARRCPGARGRGTARLQGWRFLITTDGVASIVPDGRSEVFGVLWRLTGKHVRNLDDFEGLARGWYRRLPVRVETADGPRTALVYAGSNRNRGRPRPDYLAPVVLPAARDWGLPGAYLAEIESWLPDADPSRRQGLAAGRRFWQR